MTSAPMKYGIMLDSARLTERHSFYSDLLRSLADRTGSLYARALNRWSETRFEDDPDRDGRTHIHPYDVSILYRLKTAAECFERLAIAAPA